MEVSQLLTTASVQKTNSCATSCHKGIEAVYLFFSSRKLSADKFQTRGGFQGAIKQVVLRSRVRQVLWAAFFPDRTMTYITSFDIKQAQDH
jgi:hypothetical protein